jgi:hypothetical protein
MYFEEQHGYIFRLKLEPSIRTINSGSYKRAEENNYNYEILALLGCYAA